MDADNPVTALDPIKDAPISPGVAVASLALSFALKYHDINTVQDGALYQQYKLEGKNFRELHLDVVFETAIRIEQHLLSGANRITETLVPLMVEAVLADPSDDDEAASEGGQS